MFAITNEDLEALEARQGSEELAEYISEVIEERWDDGYVCELDKAWDALHRSLTDGTLGDGGEYPLSAVIFGHEPLDAGDEYFVGLTRPADVPVVANALESVSVELLRDGYHRIPASDYGPNYGDEDLEYMLHWFAELPGFWQRARDAKRAVIFTVDE